MDAGGQPTSAPVAPDRLAPLLHWLMREGRLAPTMGKFVDAVMNRAVEAGLPIWRFYIGIRVMHPQMAATGILWKRGIGFEEIPRAHGVLETSAYIGSPMQAVRESEHMVRHHLGWLPPDAHGLLTELKAAGGIDYVAYPMHMSRDTSAPVASFATNDPAGFSAQDLKDMERLVDWMGPVAELHFHRNIAETVIDTYLGHIVGEQILGGLIRRGDGREINAVLWFSDLRDFTGLNERMTAPELLELLNNYLQLVGDALGKHGGEILKFIGDGVMAYFPADDALFLPMVTASALAAAKQLIDDVEAANEARAAGGADPLRFGVGLHVGPVTFGNVGTESRLDFTVIGPAVNRASRLEGLTKELKVPVLASAEFNAATLQTMKSLGMHTLRGVAEPVEVFTLP